MFVVQSQIYAMRITLLDNRDSFAWNLAHDLGRGGHDVHVVQEGGWDDRLWGQTDALVLSPGPGLPKEHAEMMEVLAQACERGVPILGVCLGMQAIAEHFGAKLLNLDEPLHGRQSVVAWDNSVDAWWSGLSDAIEVGHYHSWVVDELSLPSTLKAIARNEKGLLMAVVHESLPIAGVQFHPESVLTPEGRQLLQDWAAWAQRCLAISASNVSLKRS